MTLLSTHKKSFLLVLLASIITLVITGLSEQGNASTPRNPKDCCSCHSDTCNDSQAKRYVHSPVRENNCAKCHVKQVISTQNNGTNEPKAEIKWFKKIYDLADEHWFELPGNSDNLILSVQARNKNSQVLEQEIIIPSLAQIDPFPSPQEEAKILDIKVREVKQGVFISANITWHTDRICNGKLMYGQNKIEATSESDPSWSTKHEITITGLERKKNYMVAAVSQDIFGNEVTSPTISFSTHDFFSSPSPVTPEPTGDIGLTPKFFKNNERIFASFTANQPVTMLLGFRNGPGSKAATNTTELPNQHLPLTAPYELSITACISCHPGSKGKLSHPVDVKAKKGMTIPDDYTTLADGRLTCMSCHEPHAANNHFRLIRENRKALCLGCHRNF